MEKDIGWTDPLRQNTHIEGTQEEEGGLQANGEDETEDGDDDEGSDAQRLGHDDHDDQRCQDSHPQQRRQVGIQRDCRR